MESRNSNPNNDSSEIQSFPCPIRTIAHFTCNTGIKPDGLVEQMVLAENKAQDSNDVQNISISNADNSGLIVSILTDVYNKSFPILLKLLNLRPGFILRRLTKGPHYFP